VRLENSFEVSASPDAAWRLLNDVPRVIPCMPGASLDEVVDDDTFKLTMQVKLGPVELRFAAHVIRDGADEDGRRTTMAVKAREAKGRGAASARIESTLEPAGEGTRVSIVTDLQLQGTIATMGRGVVGPVAGQIVAQFADCIAKQLQSPVAAPAEDVPAEVKPVGGFALLFRSFFGVFRRRR
jgi:carbon monoxide dehydrogenase subunit G